ncbi:hypothetical protein BKA93DRAFT_781641 [Sparassis latifolia]
MKIYAGKLFDPYTRSLLENRVISVSPDSGLITDVQAFSPADAARVDFSDAEVAVDLRAATVMPGFVDVHVHLFLHPYSEVSWEDQVTKESLAERTVRATMHAKRTLMAGYTAVRDLGTEGAGDADIALRKCVSGPDPLIPGPRYFTANRAIVTTGSYGPKSQIFLNKEGIDGVTGAEVVDGEVECVKAVRRQVGAGADLIKIYSDYRFRSRMNNAGKAVSNAAIATFNEKEVHALVSTAHALGVKVAAHAAHFHPNLVQDDLLQVSSIEHGYDLVLDGSSEITDETRARMEKLAALLTKSNTKWVPTLSAYYTMDGGAGETWKRASRAFKLALECGVTSFACGGDTGVFAHGDNALEMQLMVRLGADWRAVLSWGTLGGWELVRSMDWEGEKGRARLARVEELAEDARVVGDNEVPFGAVRKGFAADIVATTGNLESDFAGAVDKAAITFVMKGGRVYKRDGKPLA